MLNKVSLNAAVKRHSHLITEGTTPEQIIEAIRADEKGFDEEGVQEIYAAMTEEVKPGGEKSKTISFVVVNPFRDINNFKKEYNEGDDVSHFDSERLGKLVKNGHVAAK